MAARAEAGELDAEGWQILGRLRLMVEGADRAVITFQAALVEFPGEPDLLAGLAEALVRRAEGVVTPQAVDFLEPRR